ncbi:MAG: RNA ligase family protein [Verrucomicrobiales bacterium]
MKTRPYKYPRTPHLPWSLGGTSDDAYLFDTTHFDGTEVVVTEKMDGENTSLYRDRMHARSLDSQNHPSRNWVKAMHGAICHEIPEGWRICGENVYARHSIAYDSLDSYFYVFSVWDDTNSCLSWQETCEWATLLGLPTVPVLLESAEWNEEIVRNLEIDTATQEGYVVRRSDAFAYDDFRISLAKWVRKGHVQTDQHWMHSEIIPNRMRTQNGR